MHSTLSRLSDCQPKFSNVIFRIGTGPQAGFCPLTVSQKKQQGKKAHQAKTALSTSIKQILNQTQKQSQPDTKTVGFADLLGLVKMHGNSKHTQYAFKQQLGGPCDALLCISEAKITVSLSEGADRSYAARVQYNYFIAAYKRSGCTYTSTQSSMHSPRIRLPTSRVVGSPADVVAEPPVVWANQLQPAYPARTLRGKCCNLRVLELHSSVFRSQR